MPSNAPFDRSARPGRRSSPTSTPPDGSPATTELCRHKRSSETRSAIPAPRRPDHGVPRRRTPAHTLSRPRRGRSRATRTHSTSCRRSVGPRPAKNLIPRHVSLRSRHAERSSQLEEVGRARQDRTVATDQKDDLVALADPERLTDGLEDRDQALRGDLRSSFHNFSLLDSASARTPRTPRPGSQRAGCTPHSMVQRH